MLARNPITSTEYYLKIYDELEIEYPPFIKMKEAPSIILKKGEFYE
ncbi:MAG: hypothetical protein Ct9H90mP18_08020 [Gammaproteobacteria bacterium]|nr:MAG: hypothetical protein Ct9H90mP18_08020 [Gammaproteobacteria bacterium]